MSVIREVLEELWSMFVGDRRLTLLVLLLVAIAASIATFAPRYGVAAAVLLLVGALAILADVVLHAARKARR
jgi:lipopolysaccharide export LptBFGC system permease protein LptF